MARPSGCTPSRMPPQPAWCFAHGNGSGTIQAHERNIFSPAVQHNHVGVFHAVGSVGSNEGLCDGNSGKGKLNKQQQAAGNFSLHKRERIGIKNKKLFQDKRVDASRFAGSNVHITETEILVQAEIGKRFWK